MCWRTLNQSINRGSVIVWLCWLFCTVSTVRGNLLGEGFVFWRRITRKLECDPNEFICFFCTGHTELYCGKWRRWQHSHIREWQMKKFCNMSLVAESWISRRDVQTDCMLYMNLFFYLTICKAKIVRRPQSRFRPLFYNVARLLVCKVRPQCVK